MASKGKKRKKRSFSFGDESFQQPDGLRTTEDLPQIASQLEIPIQGDNGMTLRTQVGRRIYNGLRHRQHVAVVGTNDSDGHGCNVNISPQSQTGLNQRDELSYQQHNSRIDNSIIDGGYASVNRKKKSKGPTYMQSIWGRPPHLPRIQVEYNKNGQPIGGNITTLTHFLGSVARNAKYCPTDVLDWHKISSTMKNEILDIVKLRFNVPSDEAEEWILSSVGHKWRNWKHYLKTRYWADVPIQHLIDERDERVPIDQWIKLLTYWSTDEAKEESKRNKEARDKKIMNQRTGKTSFAKIRATWEKENGRTPTRVEMFNKCFFNSNGSSSVAASSKYAAMQEHTNQLPEGFNDPIGPSDVFSQVMGPDKSGHVRMMGQGVCPTEVWGESSQNASNRLLMEKESRILELEAMISAQQGCITQSKSVQHSSQSNPLLTHATRTSSMQIEGYVLLQSLNSKKYVAKGLIHSVNPSTMVGGQILGSDWCEVYVLSVMEGEETLIRPYDKFQKLKDTHGEFIAWPNSLLTPVEE